MSDISDIMNDLQDFLGEHPEVGGIVSMGLNELIKVVEATGDGEVEIYANPLDAVFSGADDLKKSQEAAANAEEAARIAGIALLKIVNVFISQLT